MQFQNNINLYALGNLNILFTIHQLSFETSLKTHWYLLSLNVDHQTAEETEITKISLYVFSSFCPVINVLSLIFF